MQVCDSTVQTQHRCVYFLNLINVIRKITFSINFGLSSAMDFQLGEIWKHVIQAMLGCKSKFIRVHSCVVLQLRQCCYSVVKCD